MWKIEVPTDTPPEIELGDTPADSGEGAEREGRGGTETEEGEEEGGSHGGGDYTLCSSGESGQKAYQDRPVTVK